MVTNDSSTTMNEGAMNRHGPTGADPAKPVAAEAYEQPVRGRSRFGALMRFVGITTGRDDAVLAKPQRVLNRLASFRASLSGRLLLLAFAPMLCAVLIASVGQYLRARSDAKTEIKERSVMFAGVLAEVASQAVAWGKPNSLRSTAASLMASEPALIAIRVTHHGQPLIDINNGMANASHTLVTRHLIASASSADLQEGTDVATRAPATPAIEVVVTMSADMLIERNVRHLWLTGVVVFVGIDVGLLLGIVFFCRLRDPLQRTLLDVRAIQAGSWNAQPSARLATGELGELQIAIHRMGRAVMRSKAELTEQVESQLRALKLQTEELAQARDRALKSDCEKRRLIQQSNAAIEAERRGLAIEIHDYLNQHLYPILQLAHQMQGATATDRSAPSDMSAAGRTIVGNATALFDIFRSVIKRLRPEPIDFIGLQGALRDLMRSYLELRPETEWTVETWPSFPALHGERALAIYRIVQEALINIVKHARAGHVIVKLARDPSGVLVVAVIDDGIGFNPDTQAEGIGLIGMRERAVAEGGMLHVMSAVGAGTRVAISLPYSKA